MMGVGGGHLLLGKLAPPEEYRKRLAHTGPVAGLFREGS